MADSEELVVLGTGNATVKNCYNTCFALRCGERVFLVDTGGGNGILPAGPGGHPALSNSRYFLD